MSSNSNIPIDWEKNRNNQSQMQKEKKPSLIKEKKIEINKNVTLVFKNRIKKYLKSKSTAEKHKI